MMASHSTLEVLKNQTLEDRDSLDEDKARRVSMSLLMHYPNHPWIVSWQGRVIVVRHAMISHLCDINNLGGFGFILKHADSHSARHLSRSAMIAGGSILELFGMPRGAWDGQTMPKLPLDIKKKGLGNKGVIV